MAESSENFGIVNETPPGFPSTIETRIKNVAGRIGSFISNTTKNVNEIEKKVEEIERAQSQSESQSEEKDKGSDQIQNVTKTVKLNDKTVGEVEPTLWESIMGWFGRCSLL